MNRKIGAKDLITLGIFTVIYFVIGAALSFLFPLWSLSSRQFGRSSMELYLCCTQRRLKSLAWLLLWVY